MTAPLPSLLLTTLLTSLHMPQVRPSQPPSSLPLLILLHSVLFINAQLLLRRERSLALRRE